MGFLAGMFSQKHIEESEPEYAEFFPGNKKINLGNEKKALNLFQSNKKLQDSKTNCLNLIVKLKDSIDTI